MARGPVRPGADGGIGDYALASALAALFCSLIPLGDVVALPAAVTAMALGAVEFHRHGLDHPKGVVGGIIGVVVFFLAGVSLAVIHLPA